MLAKKLIAPVLLLASIFISTYIYYIIPEDAPVPTISAEELQEYNKQLNCLAENIYFESASEPLEGKRAVSQVVMNRINDPRYPKDVCSVVYQRRGKTFQFSWVGQKRKHINDADTWVECMNIATESMEQIVVHEELAKTNALFYHADYVRPRWKFKKVAKIGKHIFYTDNKA